MAYEEIDQKFSGKWKVDRSENFEVFLQEVGMYMQCTCFDERGYSFNTTLSL